MEDLTGKVAAVTGTASGIKKKRHRVLVGPDAYPFDISQRLFPTLYLKAVSAYSRLANRILQGKPG
ncbi:MAG: hypothetical protein ACOC78_02290 [Actinomycetota bacterium]